MQHVNKRLDVHETMLDGYMEELRKRPLPVTSPLQRGRQLVIERSAELLVIAKNLFVRRPLSRLVVG
jgi:hypothetical protein